jgi:hypothetical protein
MPRLAPVTNATPDIVTSPLCRAAPLLADSAPCPAWARIVDVPTNRHKDLVRGMRTTLERLKAAAERSTVDG